MHFSFRPVVTRVSRAPLVPAAMLVFSLVQPAIAQPDGQNLPGAVEPERPPQLLPEQVDDIVELPSLQQRSEPANADQTIVINEFHVRYDEASAVAASDQQRVAQILESYRARLSGELNISQLDQAAATVTTALRDAGYMLAQAIIPPQQVEKGIVLVQVYAGVLGRVSAQDNQLYSSEDLTRPFARQVGAVVRTADIESAVLRVNDLPGVDAVAVFAPGDAVGETRLRIRASEEDPMAFYAQVDNYGVESTGEVRLLAGVQVNNITGHRDRLRVDGVKTFSPGDLRNARVNYEITHRDLVHTLGFGYSQTEYDVEDTGDIEGETEIADIYLRSSWVRGRNFNFSTIAGLASKRAEVDFRDFDFEQGIDHLTVAEATLVFDGYEGWANALYRGSISYYRGFDDFLGSMDDRGDFMSLGTVNSQQQLPGDFDKVVLRYNRLQGLVRNHALLLRVAGQYTDDQLSSLEKMSLGGPYTVRAYPVAEYVRETAVFGSLAWVVNGGALSTATVYDEKTWADILSLSLFADYGWGKQIDGSDSSIVDRVDLSGFGLEAELNFDEVAPGTDMYSRIAIARPFNGEDAMNGEDFQYWLSLGVRF